MKLKVVRSSPEILLPTRGSDEAAGWDIYYPDDYLLYGGDAILVDTGLSVEIPKGYYLSIVLRSSLGRNGIIIPNAPAIIDSDYRGIISIILKNTSDPKSYPYSLKNGQRIAQMILHKYEEIEFEEVEKLSESKRGLGGFGSTGK